MSIVAPGSASSSPLKGEQSRCAQGPFWPPLGRFGEP